MSNRIDQVKPAGASGGRERETETTKREVISMRIIAHLFKNLSEGVRHVQ